VYVTAASDFHPKVSIVVEDLGRIPIELDAEAAPITVANFLHYVDDQVHDGSLFHRVVADFIIQAGALTLDGDEPVELSPARDPIPNESDNGLSNVRGTIAMALLQDQPDSSTRSWFINLTDENEYLDEQQFTVFGKVTGGGMDVADAISVVETGASDEPLDPVVITSIRRVDDG
jgi:cyclophilin family peptidyl-prolyl cis-trans isomerase